MIPVRTLKKWLLIVALTVGCSVSFAQKKAANPYAAIDRKALQCAYSPSLTTDSVAHHILANFTSDKEKVRAVFAWVISNFSYDSDQRFALDPEMNDSIQIVRFMRTGKGVCRDYAALFQALCQKVGLKAYIISGYTKQNAHVDNLSHAWCAVNIDQAWYLFDPTWGAGYLRNNVFVKKRNDAFFMVSPSTLIKSHMPYDYLWQFLDYPITNQEFLDGKTGVNRSRPRFHVKDSLAAYDMLDERGRLEASATRIERNGVVNSLIYDQLKTFRHNITVMEENRRAEWHKRQVVLYNAAVIDYNAAVKALNEFITYRNNQFNPVKPDLVIKKMLEEVADSLAAANLKLTQVLTSDDGLLMSIRQLETSIDDLTSQLLQQQNWFNVYVSKGKLGRRMMFIDKITWFGIPLN